MSALQYTAPDQTHHSVTMQPNSLLLDTDSRGLTLVQPVIDYLEPNGAPMQLALNSTQLVHMSVYLGSQPTTDTVLQYIDWDGKWRVAESVPIVPWPIVHMRNISLLTYNGTYSSAVNGGGLGGTPTYGVALQTDHTVASTWETFQLQFTDQTRRHSPFGQPTACRCRRRTAAAGAVRSTLGHRCIPMRGRRAAGKRSR